MTRMLKKKDVCRLVSISPATLDRYEKDPRVAFPKRVSIGNFRVAWWESEVMEWLERQAQRPLTTPEPKRKVEGFTVISFPGKR